jgi:hypothetical protein
LTVFVNRQVRRFVVAARRHLPSGIFFGRVKIRRKIVRKKLNADASTTAKLRLGDFFKAECKQVTRLVAGTFAEPRAKDEGVLCRREHSTTMAQRVKFAACP